MQHGRQLLELHKLQAARLHHALIFLVRRVDVHGAPRDLQPLRAAHVLVIVIDRGGHGAVPPDALELPAALGDDVEPPVRAAVFQRRAAHPLAAARGERERIVRLQKRLDLLREHGVRHGLFNGIERTCDQLRGGNGLLLALGPERDALLHADRDDRAALALRHEHDVAERAPVARRALGGEELAEADDSAENVGRLLHGGIIDDSGCFHGYPPVSLFRFYSAIQVYYNTSHCGL